ncbi:NADPH-dependent FMN reductase [Emticicia oligotrophica DSM 17448]|uniref:NADPH-dependent FMN reductase n=1 Tax=Emticicia oligotrophica (strain DSM 17448 / CIP 109782 / MTCC 6937 / GPTSA100-15) TaxID=929562 RepID=A0ABM5N2A2_EMTOG|nr:NAD(P)H-dependent oxidoreductase [Emticicia oligotrophica]AFK03551.1 NADPH-dependent FMN reductase [Emticicia oligotrophica DSM 17448]
MKIEIISGSPRHESITVRVAQFLQKYLSETATHEVNLLDVRDFPLPAIQKVWTSIEAVPAEWKSLGERVFSADAFILVTPEFNGGYSPALKNLLDHFPKQSHKPFGIVTASVGAMGGMRASQQMLLLVGALFGIVSPQMLITPLVDKKFDAEGNLLDEGFLKQIEVFIKEYLWLAEKLVK